MTKKFSQFTATVTPTLTDEVVGLQGGVNKRTTLQKVKDLYLTGLTTNYVLYKTSGGLGNSPVYISGSNVLIGTTTDNGALLQVNGTGYILGNTGIGTSSPATIISGVETTLNVKGNLANAAGSVVARSFGSINATSIGLYAADTVNEVGLFGESNSDVAIWSNSVKRYTITAGGKHKRVLQLGNSGLSSGEEYYDTAANVLSNGDYVIARKA